MLKKSQQKLNLGFSIFILLLILLLLQVSVKLALTFAVSLGLGFVLQKSRFCFVSAFRDPLLTGTTKLTEAVILLLAISVPGFAIVYHLAETLNYPLQLYVTPFGIHTFMGGILFGTGMVLAGGCASGVLMRIGEGFAMQMVALGGLLIGVFIGKNSIPFMLSTFYEFPGIFLPDIMGWGPAVALQLFILFVLWKVTRWWQKKQKGFE
ncbi:YeeE/YedE thiosulfate transporter family protein [Desulfitobacterium sp. THU1]|uniref:YeeE/YedE thiosulfate transporter family protein n=1 Tax=Desulfitobacterium sp. THU1 TaxID=3138072 RepID=UPI00311F7ADA